MLDLILRNALLFDGTDRAPQKCRWVSARGGLKSSDRIEQPAAREIDATGLWLDPGFIDIHTHYDLEVEVNPGLAESVRHGVTICANGQLQLVRCFAVNRRTWPTSFSAWRLCRPNSLNVGCRKASRGHHLRPISNILIACRWDQTSRHCSATARYGSA